MKKLFLVSLIILLLAATSTGFAASARWLALGYDHRFMLDTSNYPIYPGRMLMFSDALWIVPNVAGVPDNMRSGLLVKKDDCAWAIHYNLPGAEGFSALRAALPAAGGNLAGLAGSLRPFPDIFLAKKVGDMTVGGRVVLGIAGSENALEEAASAMSVDVAAGVTKPIALGDLDLGVRVSMATFSDESPVKKIESTGGIGLGADVRLIMDKGEGKKLIPVLRVHYVTDPVVDGAAEVSEIGVNIGCGLNKRGANKSMLVTGVVLHVHMETTSPVGVDDKTVTTMEFSYLGGYEKPLNSWLIGRGGARATLTMVSGDVPASKGAAFYYNFGVRATYKKVLLDLLLSQGLLHRGPYMISGSPANLATNVCLTYLL